MRSPTTAGRREMPSKTAKQAGTMISKQRARLGAIALLGGKCSYCGIDDPIVLNIDHVNDDGSHERKKLNPSQLCARLVKGTLPKERYQLLCCNCNWRKEYLRRTGRQEPIVLPVRRKNQNDGKTHCVNGHPFTDENTYARPDGYRACKKCNLEAQKRYAEQKPEAA